MVKTNFRAPLPDKPKKVATEKPLKLSRTSSLKSLKKLSKKKLKEEKKKEKEERKKTAKKVKGKRGRKKKELSSGLVSKPEVVKNGNNENTDQSPSIEIVPIQSSDVKETKTESSNDFHFLCTICKFKLMFSLSFSIVTLQI